MQSSVQRLFDSANIKLASAFLGCIMLLSIGFSILVYRISASEIDARFDVIQTRLHNDKQKGGIRLPNNFNFAEVRVRQLLMAEKNIFYSLLYINIVIFFIGGAGSYILARKILQPIKQAHEAQARFTSDASHELRTPLTIMKTELELAASDPKFTKKEYRELVSSSLEEVDRLTKLSETLLKLSRLEHVDITFSPHTVEELYQSALSGIKKSDSTRIKTVFSKTLPKVAVNPESISEVFIILLDNALKYSTPKTPITISAKKKGSRVLCSIKNIGEGIPEDKINDIFRRFYQADASKQTTGYGLGLPLAAKIITLHGGELGATSKLGDSTTFYFTLAIAH